MGADHGRKKVPLGQGRFRPAQLHWRRSRQCLGRSAPRGHLRWPAFTGVNLPGGGLGYPLATPGVRVKLGNDSDPLNVLVAVFNGNPAGQCDQDPQICNRYGTNFPLQNPPLVMQEVQYRYNQGKDDKALAGSIKVGAFQSFRNFNHLRYDALACRSASPLAALAPC
nr:carbohydrate porin [Rhodoblastus acidophilus]